MFIFVRKSEREGRRLNSPGSYLLIDWAHIRETPKKWGRNYDLLK